MFETVNYCLAISTALTAYVYNYDCVINIIYTYVIIIITVDNNCTVVVFGRTTL